MGNVEVIDIGNTVLCDGCNTDFTGRDDSGGFLFGSYAYAPCCADRMLENIRRHNEEHLIKAWCPAGKSYRQWVLEDLRQGNNSIVTHTFDSKEEMQEFLRKETNQ